MRNRYSAAGIILALMLALGLMAWAQTPGSAPPASTPQTTSPSPNAAPDQPGTPPQTAQPAEPGSPAQGTPQAGSAAPNGQQGAGAQSAQPGNPADELHLTEAQKQQLRPIIDKEVKEIEAVRDDQSMPMDQKRAKVEQIRQTYFPQIQAILTPEQRQKLEEMRKERQQQANPQGENPQAQPPSQPPH